MPRMGILSSDEQQAFDKPPQLDHREWKKFFEFSKGLLDNAQDMRSLDHLVGFLVKCVYFRAMQKSFMPADFGPRDVAYVANQLGAGVTSNNTYPNRTCQRHQQLVLNFHGFAPFDAEAETALAAEVAKMTRVHLKPRLIFDRCVDFLKRRRVQIPSGMK